MTHAASAPGRVESSKHDDDDDDEEEGDIPAVHINNAVLRKHFRKLTAAFLKPLER